MGDDVGPPPIPFTSVPGPKHAPPPEANPIDYLNLFFTDNFMDTIVTETNRYADQWVDSHQEYLREKPRSRVHYWIKQGHTTKEEFNAFLGITLNMGLIRKPSINSYWDSTHDSQHTPWFIEHFNRDRFQLLLKFMHFANNERMPPAEDPNFKL